MNYINKLVEYFKDPKKNNKDLLVKLRIWREEFDKEAQYNNLIDYTKAKQKYILMRWCEDDWKTESKGRGSYQDEEDGIYY